MGKNKRSADSGLVDERPPSKAKAPASSKARVPAPANSESALGKAMGKGKATSKSLPCLRLHW